MHVFSALGPLCLTSMCVKRCLSDGTRPSTKKQQWVPSWMLKCNFDKLFRSIVEETEGKDLQAIRGLWRSFNE